MAKKKTLQPKLTDIEEDLLAHLEQGYQLESNSVGGGLLLRRLKDDTTIRPASANQSTIKALEKRGLIKAIEGDDAFTTIWRLQKKAPQ